jgi:hypothetical protein
MSRHTRSDDWSWLILLFALLAIGGPLLSYAREERPCQRGQTTPCRMPTPVEAAVNDR